MIWLAASAVLAATSVAAQPAAPADERPRLDSSLRADTIVDLPSTDNLYFSIETTQAEVTSDRFHAGGLDTGRPARIGAFLNSWSQTQFRVGDVNVTIPDGGGAPFLFPLAAFWERIDVTTGLMPADVNAPSLAISLEPRRPSTTWQHTAEGSLAGGGLTAEGGTPPPIARLDNWAHASLVSSGPVRHDRIGLVTAVAYSRAEETDRRTMAAVTGDVASAFAHLVFTPATGDEFRTIAWIQQARYPFAAAAVFGQPLSADRDRFGHVQSTWERRLASGTSWRLFGAYSRRDKSRDLGALSGVATLDRLLDGPVANAFDTGDHTDDRWSLGARIRSAPRLLGNVAHTLSGGVDVEGARSRVAPGLDGPIRELLDGVPARVWSVTSPSLEEHRHETMVAAFLAHHMAVGSRFSLDSAVRYDGVSGSADGAATGVVWHSVLPRFALQWNVARTLDVSVFAGYSRSADQLSLGLLAVGDPAAPTALVARATGAGLAPVVARTGPGTAGDPQFSRIDPSLARPSTDELIVGVQSRPDRRVRLRFAGILKREQDLIELVDSGAPASSYRVGSVVDSIADPAHPDAVQLLPTYNRIPSTFGLDRYVLTNPTQDRSTFQGLTFTADVSADRLFVLFGATAAQTDAPASNRGFHAEENDAGVLGELFIDPNAATFARGRLFIDRAYTLKLSAVYRFPAGVRLGAIARYQDGQPFSRMVVVPALNQGPEAIRAYAAGDTRFTYIGTLDVRLQKGFSVNGRRLDVVVDAYNAINLGNEVEERVITGSGFRTVTAVQPPRTVHLGLRLAF